MVVTLGDVVHRVRVKPGEDGQKEFQQEIRRLFQIPDEVEFEVRGVSRGVQHCQAKGEYTSCQAALLHAGILDGNRYAWHCDSQHSMILNSRPQCY
jgi:hypothetical protein